MDLQILNSVGLIEIVFTLLGVILVYKSLKNVLDNTNEKLASKPTATRRRLDKHEGLMYLLSQEREGTAEITLIFSLRSRTKLVKEYVNKAFVMLAKRQPMLRAVITTSISTYGEKERYFEIVDGNRITDMVDLTSSEVKARQWQDVWYEIVAKQRVTRLLWKAVILKEEFIEEENCYANTLIFNSNHCIIDGVSSMKFCQQFLHYLNGLAEGSLTSDMGICSLSLSPSFVDLLTQERPWSIWQFLASCLGIPWVSKFMARQAFRRSQSRQQCNPFFAQFPPNPNPFVPPKSNSIFKIFNEIETLKIVEACKLNGCTVTGALMAASHMAFCQLIQDQDCVDKDIPLLHLIAINAQRSCQPKPPKDYLGHFASLQPLLMSYADVERDFWQVAQEYTKRIHSELRDEKYAKDMRALLDCLSTDKPLNEFGSPLDRQDLIRLSTCTNVSSVGSFDFREEQNLYRYKLHECIFNIPVHGLACAFVHLNTTVNGKMSWAVTYDPSKVVDGAQAQRFANLCFDYFLQISK